MSYSFLAVSYKEYYLTRMKGMLLIIFMFIYGNCIGQNKKDNVIVLPFVQMETIKEILFRNGYNITSNDSNYISTSSKELRTVSMAVKLMIQRKGTITYVSGLIKPTLSTEIFGVKTESDFEQLIYEGMKGSPLKKVWSEMDRIARLLSSNITYAKQ